MRTRLDLASASPVNATKARAPKSSVALSLPLAKLGTRSHQRPTGSKSSRQILRDPSPLDYSQSEGEGDSCESEDSSPPTTPVPTVKRVHLFKRSANANANANLVTSTSSSLA